MWALQPGIEHLNHGSFGAVPIPVSEAQQRWRRRFEANPTGFVVNELQTAVDEARAVLADFVGVSPETLAFVANATTAVNSVLRSIEPALGPGDEVLTTDHSYDACRNALDVLALRTGAEIVVVEIPFPVGSPARLADRILSRAGRRTRLVLIDHITSPTGLILPVESIVSELEPDVPVLVDGAHGPGQVPLALGDLGASWYVGNLHKWTCGPRGSAFLQTRRDRLDMTFPAVISQGWSAPVPDSGTRYHPLFDWVGTIDYTAWLTVPDALSMVGGSEPGGWPAVMKRNHELVVGGRRLICEALGIDPPAPDELLGSMASVPLPDGIGPDPGDPLSPEMARLEAQGFETLAMVWPRWPKQVLRVSAHVYNTLDQFERLAGYLGGR